MAMPGVPPEVQRQADEYADELWASIEKDASRSDTDMAQLERIKPMVLQALRLAFIRGALISVQAGLFELKRIAARKRPRLD